VDLSDEHDVRATISGLQGSPLIADASQADAPVVVHFGDGDFASKYQTLLSNIAEYRARVGRLNSLDLRFNGQVVANPDTTAPAPAAAHPQASGKQSKSAQSRKGGVSTPP